MSGIVILLITVLFSPVTAPEIDVRHVPSMHECVLERDGFIATQNFINSGGPPNMRQAPVAQCIIIYSGGYND